MQLQFDKNRDYKKCANCNHREKYEIDNSKMIKNFFVVLWFPTLCILTSAYPCFGAPCYYRFYLKVGAYHFLLHHNHRYYYIHLHQLHYEHHHYHHHHHHHNHHYHRHYHTTIKTITVTTTATKFHRQSICGACLHFSSTFVLVIWIGIYDT